MLSLSRLPRNLVAAGGGVVVAGLIVLVLVAVAAGVRAAEEDPCAEAPRSDFSDRDEAAAVHRPNIDCVDYYAITSGTGDDGNEFDPKGRVTRGQMATFLIATIEAAGLGDRLPSGDPPDEFDDIASSVHRENINRLARTGIARGVGNDRFAPQRPLPRDQMASFLLQTAEWAYGTEYTPDASHFGDVSERNVHHDNIDAAFELDLVSGTKAPTRGRADSGEFRPGRLTMREAMASFLARELAFVFEAEPDPCATETASPSEGASETETSSECATGSPSPSGSASPSETASPTSSPSPSETASGGLAVPAPPVTVPLSG